MKFVVLLCCLVACALAASNKPLTGTLEDVEHIVVFMQENRAFDHYYGTLAGVRGFNDRAAPILPSGRPVWYQPTAPIKPVRAFCGCGEFCDLEWTSTGAQVRSILLGLDCSLFVSTMASATPAVTVTDGELCSQVLSAVRGAVVDHLKVGDALAANSSCDASARTKFASDSTPISHNPQKTHDVKDGDVDYMLPFPLLFDRTSATCMDAPNMGYFWDVGMWNNGKMDSWNTARPPGFGMSFFNRTDLPYYYALADAFTIGDQYYQSTFTETNPNRLHLFAGSNGLSVGAQTVILNDDEPIAGINWLTFAESLEAANISWKVYQEMDNFDDNGFAWFENFEKAQPGSPLYDKGMARVADLIAEFSADLSANTLPQVSWIVGPTNMSEHATNHPQNGEDFTARLLQVLALPEHRAIYNKTVFIINYDEGGQFFDHHWVPTPPASRADGLSTVDIKGELTTVDTLGIPAGNPIGLGFRVPLFIISPWTRGPLTYSEVTDHTSVIKFIEKRFGVHCPNISPWRRAVVGDLLAAFNFSSHDSSWPDSFPDTSHNEEQSQRQCDGLPAPTVPSLQTMPSQEPGTRLSRPLPYEISVTADVTPTAGGISGGTGRALTLTMNNTGAAGVVLLVFNLVAPDAGPRKYTVEAGKSLSDSWQFGTTYSLSLHGPNGFVRQFSGTYASAPLAADLAYSRASQSVTVTFSAAGGAACQYDVVDNAYGHGQWSGVTGGRSGRTSLRSHPKNTSEVSNLRSRTDATEIDISHSGNWYDLTVTSNCFGEGTFARRFMGRMETGLTTTTDPAMSKPTVTSSRPVPMHPSFRALSGRPWERARICKKRRNRMKDACGLAASDGEL